MDRDVKEFRAKGLGLAMWALPYGVGLPSLGLHPAAARDTDRSQRSAHRFTRDLGRRPGQVDRRNSGWPRHISDPQCQNSARADPSDKCPSGVHCKCPTNQLLTDVGLSKVWDLHLHSVGAMTPTTTLQAPPTRTREDNPQLLQAHAKLAQLEQLLKQGRTHLQGLRTQADEAKKERDELRRRLEHAEAEREDIGEKHDQLAFLLSELRSDRDRVADELKSTELHRASIESQLEAATGGLEQLREAADRALSLAREIVDGYAPVPPPGDAPAAAPGTSA
jgi:hypothetical protein